MLLGESIWVAWATYSAAWILGIDGHALVDVIGPVTGSSAHCQVRVT